MLRPIASDELVETWPPSALQLRPLENSGGRRSGPSTPLLPTYIYAQIYRENNLNGVLGAWPTVVAAGT